MAKIKDETRDKHRRYAKDKLINTATVSYNERDARIDEIREVSKVLFVLLDDPWLDRRINLQ